MNNKKTKIVSLNLGKCAYYGTSKIYPAVVNFGFRYLSRNSESYFTCTAEVWNRIETDIICGGCGVQNKLMKHFPDNEILKEICELAEKIHLKMFSLISYNDMQKALELMAKVENE